MINSITHELMKSIIHELILLTPYCFMDAQRFDHLFVDGSVGGDHRGEKGGEGISPVVRQSPSCPLAAMGFEEFLCFGIEHNPQYGAALCPEADTNGIKGQPVGEVDGPVRGSTIQIRSDRESWHPLSSDRMASCDLHLFFPNHGAVPPKSDFISRSNSLDKLSCN